MIINEPPHEKTNNVIAEQVLHKPSCTSIEDDLRLENVNFERNCTIRGADRLRTLRNFKLKKLKIFRRKLLIFFLFLLKTVIVGTR